MTRREEGDMDTKRGETMKLIEARLFSTIERIVWSELVCLSSIMLSRPRAATTTTTTVVLHA